MIAELLRQTLLSSGVAPENVEVILSEEEAIDTALKVLKGEQVPKKIVLGSRLFTSDNVEQGGAAIGAE